MTVGQYLYELTLLPGFKMYKEPDSINGDLMIEIDGIKFNCCCYCLDEAIPRAVIFFSERLARKKAIEEMQNAIPKV